VPRIGTLPKPLSLKSLPPPAPPSDRGPPPISPQDWPSVIPCPLFPLVLALLLVVVVGSPILLILLLIPPPSGMLALPIFVVGSSQVWPFSDTAVRPPPIVMLSLAKHLSGERVEVRGGFLLTSVGSPERFLDFARRKRRATLGMTMGRAAGYARNDNGASGGLRSE